MGMRRRQAEAESQPKFLDVDASMQGSLVFKDPVNLRINGHFEGALTTRGNLVVGETAMVRADVEGDAIVIAGELHGNVRAHERLELRETAKVFGDIKAPLLAIQAGASLQGRCDMQSAHPQHRRMSVEELAGYLEVDRSAILDWAGSGRLPGIRDGEAWQFDRAQVDEWVASEKIR